MDKTKVAILGSGNIGTDLMMKLSRSSVLELTTVIGIDPESDGLRKAGEMGYETISNGIEGFLARLELADIVFDATSAKAHLHHAKVLEEAGKITLDLTPAAIGPFVVPPVNLNLHNDKKNVNLVTCGGQATIPMVHAVNRIVPVEYAEIVATISSKSAGPGTRANIDEFTITTARAIEEVGGAKKGKAIIILNPADPPIIMRDTVYIETAEIFNEADVRESIDKILKEVQSYVPGYSLVTEPIISGNVITIMLEVEGAGDYLPHYSGNLDIMTAAAVKTAEQIAMNQVLVKGGR
ncbi:acetaldehyde dehydrogenase (acetylating) [Actinomycetes bacterium NPDC127524]